MVYPTSTLSLTESSKQEIILENYFEGFSLDFVAESFSQPEVANAIEVE